jgi:hypothetical protein
MNNKSENPAERRGFALEEFMNFYTTVSGDMWDGIAHREMGNALLKDRLMNANRRHRHIYIFSAGIELVIPAVPAAKAAGLPPWRRGGAHE